MNDNIKAGGDIHAGDGGYSIGTEEKYDEFAKGRNQSMGRMRIQQLAEQATDTVENVNPDTGITHHREFFDKEKFAELIVQECARAIINDSRLNDVRSASRGCVRTIREHFGVEE